MHILENSKVIFFWFILLGFMVPQFADDLKIFLIPLLILMMTLSIKGVKIDHISKKNYKNVLGLILINYFILTPMIILLSMLLIKNQDYKNGFIILASVPPAASIIPLSYIYHGDIKNTILGEIACYLFALIYSPLLVYLFLKEAVDISYYLKILFLIILLPIAISRLLHKYNWKIFEKKNIFVNLIYGFSFYIFIGINHSKFTSDIFALIPVAIVILFITFFLGSVIFVSLKYKKISLTEDIIFVLFGTFKNGNSAATISLILFGPAAVIPVAVKGLITPFYFVYLEKIFHAHFEDAQ